MLKKLKLSATLVLFLGINSSFGADVLSADVLELTFHSMCKPVRAEPAEFNQIMKDLHNATVVYTSKPVSSVDRALDALEKLTCPTDDIRTLLMPFADFTRCLNRHRPSIIPHGEESAPIDPLINTSEKAFNIIVAALFDFCDQSAFETFRKAFSTGQQAPQTLCIGADGKFLSINGQVIDESIFPEQDFYPLIRQATADFMKSILSIWESPFMRELVKSKRVKVLKAKPPVAAQTIINPVQVVADTDDAESEDGFEVVKHPDSVNAVAYF